MVYSIAPEAVIGECRDRRHRETRHARTIAVSDRLDFLAASYGFSSLTAAVDHRLGDGRALRALDGNGDSYVVKQQPHYVDPDDFACCAELHRRLHRCGAPVSEILTARSGAASVVTPTGRFTVQRFIGGRPAETAGDLEVFGRALAEMHLDGTTLPPEWPRGDWTFPSGRERWLPDLPSSLLAAARHWIRDGVADAVVARLRALAGNARAACDVSGMPTTFIHGDASPTNCVVDGDGTASLVDLDEVRWGLPLFDLVQAMVIVAGVERDASGLVIRSSWHTGRSRAVAHGYLAARELSDAELSVVHPLATLTTIRVLAGELDLDDPAVEGHGDARTAVDGLLQLLDTVDDLVALT